MGGHATFMGQCLQERSRYSNRAVTVFIEAVQQVT